MKIAVFAPFGDFSDSYSLTHVVLGQVRALMSRGHDVSLWCLRNAKLNNPKLRNIQVFPCITAGSIESDKIDEDAVPYIEKDIRRYLDLHNVEVVITHDAMFQAGYVNFASAIHNVANDTSRVAWLHYVHSFLSQPPAILTKAVLKRTTIPKNHAIVYPNNCWKSNVAAYYGVDANRVFYCPNVRDVRDQWTMTTQAAGIVHGENLIHSDLVQIFPACSTRLLDKGADHLIEFFRRIERRGYSSKLVIVNPNARLEKAKEVLAHLKSGLPSNVVFTSDLLPETADEGLPSRTVSDLFRFCNLFANFSRGEAGPLILAEAQANGALCVLNGNVSSFREFGHGSGALFFPMPSWEKNVEFRAVRVVRQTDTATGAVLSEQKTELVGREAYEAHMDTIVNETLQRWCNDPTLLTRKTAMTRHSYEKVGSVLEGICAEVLRRIP